MKNFIDFIVDSSKQSDMAEEFHKIVQDSDHAKLSSWLKEKGYDVKEDECKKMIDNKDDIKSSKLGFAY